MAAVSAAVVTATPAERSNSPPIINSATATAMMPTVELAYRTVAIEAALRIGGAIAKNKMKTAIAPTSEPTSGRTRNLRTETVLRTAAGGVAGGAGPISVVLMICSLGTFAVLGRERVEPVRRTTTRVPGWPSATKSTPATC